MRSSARTSLMCAQILIAAGAVGGAFGYGGFNRSYTDDTSPPDERDLEALRKAEAKRERKQNKRLSTNPHLTDHNAMMTTLANPDTPTLGYLNSVTFLNMSGDITISWDEHNRDHIVAMVKKKMAEGYVFFTTKKVPLIEIYRKVKVTPRNLSTLSELSIPDVEFEKMVAGMDDRDLVELVHRDKAHLAKRTRESTSRGKREMTTVKRIYDAEEVIENQSVGIRPLQGG